MQELSFQEQTALGFLANARKAKTQADADWHMRHAVKAADKAGTTIEAIEAKAAAKVEPAKVQCSVKAIRRFFAICKSVGVDTKDESHVRGALSVFFGRRIASRKELTTDQWLRAGDAIESRRLVF